MSTYTIETYLTARDAVREVEVSHPAYTVECALTRPAYVVETGLDLAPPAPTAPVNTVAPVVSGTPTEGETLSCTTGTWTGTEPITYEYQWTLDLISTADPIFGANGPTYVLTAGDVGVEIFCAITAINAAGIASALSNKVGPVASAGTAPVNTVAPVASGTVRIGELLSTTDGTWTGTPTPTYAYQWTRDGSPIGGATSATYTVVAADIACEIACEVTASNSAGSVMEPSNDLASPWRPILALYPGALIWDGLDPYCYGGAGIGDPVEELYTVDGVLLATQTITSKQATCTATALDYDGLDDTYDGVAGLATYWQADQTYLAGVAGLAARTGEVIAEANGGAATPNRSALIANSTNNVRNVHRTSDAGASMLGLTGDPQNWAVVWQTGTPGAGELFDLASGVASVRTVAPASLPARAFTQWQLGGNLADTLTWQGNIRWLVIDDSAWSSSDLTTARACAVAAGVL